MTLQWNVQWGQLWLEIEVSLHLAQAVCLTCYMSEEVSSFQDTAWVSCGLLPKACVLLIQPLGFDKRCFSASLYIFGDVLFRILLSWAKDQVTGKMFHIQALAWINHFCCPCAPRGHFDTECERTGRLVPGKVGRLLPASATATMPTLNTTMFSVCFHLMWTYLTEMFNLSALN